MAIITKFNPLLNKRLQQVNIGDAIPFTTQTTNNTSTLIAAIPVALDSVKAFSATVIGFEPLTRDSWVHKIEGAIKNNATTTSLIDDTDTYVAEDIGAATWSITILADNGTDELKISVTGENGKTINWRIEIKLSQLS